MSVGFSWRVIAGAGGLLLFALLIAFGLHWHTKAAQYQEQITRLQAENTTQSAIISKQSLQFNRFNQIAASAQQASTATEAQAQEKQIEYRTILKKEPTCNLPVPAAIAGRLLDYTHRLRTSAMHADPGKSDSTGTGTTTAGALTYCQAVLWVDPLLVAIEKANTQLEAIRQIEKDRRNDKAQ